MNHIVRTTWSEQKASIRKVNPELVKTIDELELGDDLPLYRATYPYGSKLLHKGKFQVINDAGSSVDLLDSSIDKKIQKDLGYAQKSLPLGVVLEKNLELYGLSGQAIVPVTLFKPGDVIVLSSVLNPKENDNGGFLEASAGARTAVSTMKISDYKNIRRLEDLLIRKIRSPSGYYDHADLFEEIAGKNNAKWALDIIFFTKDWVQEKKDFRWKAFKCYLHECNQKAFILSKRQSLKRLIYSELKTIFKESKAYAYLYPVINHLIEVSAGYSLAFSVADNDEALPLKLIMKRLVEVYDTKGQYPVIMTLDFLSQAKKNAVYYSLASPLDHQELNFYRMKSGRKSQEIEEVIKVLRNLQEYFGEKYGDLKGGFYDSIKSFSGCQLIEHHSTQINHHDALIKNDPHLRDVEKRAQSLDLTVQYNNPFFNGLIQIAKNSNR